MSQENLQGGQPSPAQVATPQQESASCRAEKQRKILTVAAQAFATQDFHKVRTDEIATAAGVGKGTLFRYFATKEDLFVAAMIYGLEMARAEIDRALAGVQGPADRLETACRHLVTFYRANECLFHLLHHERTLREHARHAEFHARQEALRTKLAEILRDGQEAGCFRKSDPAITGRLFFGMLRTALRMTELRERPANEVAAVILDLFLRGVGKAPGKGSAAPPGSPGA